ncbi:MAG TPA: MFS transporter [Bryobacteraceae bacterium]|nr:MFS transporter [Bryobacteraceae bacterium]
MNFRIQRNFAKLWTGQTISEVGSRITREGLPLTALLTLKASAGQMGLLSAISSASVLVFGLGAGVAVDRWKKRPVMIATDLGRAGLLGLIPLAAHRHILSLSILIAVAVLAGAFTVLFDVAYQSYLPALVEPEELLESNKRLSLSTAAAEMAGPALTGALVQAITAPLAILVDAFSFLVSAFSVYAIRKAETLPERKRDVPLLSEALDGLRFIWTHPALRALLLRSATAFLFMGFIFPLYLLNAIRIVHMSTSALGIAIALGGAGSLVGAYLAPRFSTRHGLGPIFFGTAILIGCAQLLIPLSSEFPRIGLLCLCLQQLGGDMVWTVYVVNETALRQFLAPGQVIGRVNAAMQLASRGMLPFGALFGGFLAGRIGVPVTLLIGAGGVLLSSLWLAPLRSSREIR